WQRIRKHHLTGCFLLLDPPVNPFLVDLHLDQSQSVEKFKSPLPSRRLNPSQWQKFLEQDDPIFRSRAASLLKARSAFSIHSGSRNFASSKSISFSVINSKAPGEVGKPVRRQSRVPDRVLDIGVAEVLLDSPGVHATVGHVVA